MQTQEAVKQYILPKKSVLKLEIVQFLLKHDFFISIQYLAKQFEMTEANFQQYIREINKDFKLIADKEVNITQQKKFVKIDILARDTAYQYYQLFGHYCMTSTNYLVLTSLFNKQVTSVVRLSHETNYSISYVYTCMKQINQFLALYGFQIYFSKSGEKVITGSEFQIQYCFLDVYWNVFSNTRLPFQEKTDEKVVSVLNQNLKSHVLQTLTRGSIYKLYLLLKICTTNFPYTSMERVQEEIKKNPGLNMFLRSEIDILNSKANVTDEQRIIINTLARMAISKIEDDEKILAQYQLLEERQIPFFVYSKLLIETFCQKFQLELPWEKQILYTLNLLRNRIYNSFLTDTQPSTPMSSVSLYQDQSHFVELKDRIEQFYLAFREKEGHYIPELQGKENVFWVVDDLLHIYERYRPVKPITIGVNYTRDYYISEDIISKIEQLYSAKNMVIQKNRLEECDIVISDCPLTSLPERIKKIYIIDDLMKKSEWENIFSMIGANILEIRIRDFD